MIRGRSQGRADATSYLSPSATEQHNELAPIDLAESGRSRAKRGLKLIVSRFGKNIHPCSNVANPLSENQH